MCQPCDMGRSIAPPGIDGEKEGSQLSATSTDGPACALREENLPVPSLVRGSSRCSASLPESSPIAYGKALANRPTWRALVHLLPVSAFAVEQGQGKILMQRCKGARERGRLHPELQTPGSLPIILSLGSFPASRSVCFPLVLRNSTKNDATTHRNNPALLCLSPSMKHFR